MSPPILIRSIEEADVDRLETEHPEPGAPTSRHRERWSLQRRGEGVYLICWRGDRPIGWVFVHPPGSTEASEHARRVGAAQIVGLFVEPPSRGRGHGASLLGSAEQRARDAGWPLVGLEVTVSNPHNDVARALYVRHGYRDSGLGEFESGYFYWTGSGERRWDGEPHRFLIKSVDGG